MSARRSDSKIWRLGLILAVLAAVACGYPPGEESLEDEKGSRPTQAPVVEEDLGPNLTVDGKIDPEASHPVEEDFGPNLTVYDQSAPEAVDPVEEDFGPNLAVDEQIAAEASAPVIAAAGDIACAPGDKSNPCRHKATSDLLVGAGLAAVLPLGDLQYEAGALSAFNASYGPTWGRVLNLTRPTPGNHEYRTSGASGYFTYFNGSNNCGRAGCRGQGYYTYTVGSWRLIALNSNISRTASSAQLNWLRNTLSKSTARCVLAYWHHPRFSSGDHGNNASVGPFWDALYARHADVVLVGHAHNYERFARMRPNGTADSAHGIRQFVVGTGGKNLDRFQNVKPNSQFRRSNVFGVLKLTLKSGGYDWRFVAPGGAVIDSGSGNCHD